MKLGDKVHCTAYAERTKRGINVVDTSPFFIRLNGVDSSLSHKAVSYYDENKKDIVSIPFGEFTDATIDKFKIVEKEFDGIYVGTTRLATKLSATYETPPYGNDYIRFESECVKSFAVIYYANNRKRLVPIDCVQEVVL